MSDPCPPADATNPFASRCVRPGAIPFIFPAGIDADVLVERLRQFGWRGAIIGPHGSGKSTLLAALSSALGRAGRSTVLVELHDGQRRFPFERLAGAVPGQVVLVDGFEQLGPWSRWRLRRRCARESLGLLITAHRPAGLRTIYQTSVDLPLAQRIVDHLLGPDRAGIPPATIAASLARHRANLREVLFDLYDLY